VQRLNLDVERAEVPVAVLVFDAGIGKLDVAVVVGELVLDGPTMDFFGRSIGLVSGFPRDPDLPRTAKKL
jgi:hypothetical protein